jgi:hypothetical protein
MRQFLFAYTAYSFHANISSPTADSQCTARASETTDKPEPSSDGHAAQTAPARERERERRKPTSWRYSFGCARDTSASTPITTATPTVKKKRSDNQRTHEIRYEWMVKTKHALKQAGTHQQPWRTAMAAPVQAYGQRR